MVNLNLEDDIKQEVFDSLEEGFGIYDLVLVYGKDSLKIRVFLDKYTDPWGTPNISDCERFSHAVDSRLMNLVSSGKMTDQYTLEVSSPGAERELKTPEEWARFQDKMVKLRYRVSGDKFDTIVAKFLRMESGMTYWRRVATKKDRINKNKVQETEMGIQIEDINHVRLYLEF